MGGNRLADSTSPPPPSTDAWGFPGRVSGERQAGRESGQAERRGVLSECPKGGRELPKAVLSPAGRLERGLQLRKGQC